MKSSEIFKQFVEHMKPLGLATRLSWDQKSARASLIISAKNRETGAVVVYDDADELTVTVGQIFHRHYGSHIQQDEGEAVAQACEFLKALTNDALVIYVSVKDGKVLGGGACAPADLPEIQPENRYYTWSGPYKPN